MSRSGYYEDGDTGENWSMICWRGAVKSAIRGKKGQALFREMLAALDAMPVKELVAGELQTPELVGGHGCNPIVVRPAAYCALGVVGKARGILMADVDPEESRQVALAFDIADALAREITYHNDECGGQETPAQRWVRMRAWVVEQIKTI